MDLLALDQDRIAAQMDRAQTAFNNAATGRTYNFYTDNDRIWANPDGNELLKSVRNLSDEDRPAFIAAFIMTARQNGAKHSVTANGNVTNYHLFIKHPKEPKDQEATKPPIGLRRQGRRPRP